MRVGVSAETLGANPNQTRCDLDMADIIIPPPGPDGYWHFTYITTDTLDGRWYGGKRSTKKHPLSDRYLGSGNWVRSHPARERLKRAIVAFYPSSAEVFAAEAQLITWTIVMDNPLCMNLWAGGKGSTSEAALHRSADPEWRENNLSAVRLRSANSEWRANQIVGAAKRLADPGWQESNKAAALIRSGDRQWRANHSAAMVLVGSDPQWRENHLDGIARRTENPEWPIAHAMAMEKRSSNQDWKINLTASIRRVTKTSEWKEAQQAGSRRRSVVFIELNGKRVSVADACRETGISYKLVLNRRRCGWPESEWLIPPTRKRSA